ncbi:MAG: hypothetical protein RIC38_14475 [Chromatocurvus sp.]
MTYDTGGADIKVGGHMAGMSRDKGGGAAVAGFMRTLAELAPPDLSVIALIGAVRNSIGADAFVADEIITARSGRRVRIGNTDAEGRLVMADILTQLREEALEAVAPTLFTVATLTGHAALCHGPYSAYVDNPVARRQGIAACIVACGDAVGDPGEVMRLRREDWQQNRARSAAEQGDWQFGKPTGAPLMALAGAYLRQMREKESSLDDVLDSCTAENVRQSLS